MAKILKPVACHLVGIDVSNEMVEKSKELDIYDSLLNIDICEFLKKSKKGFDLIILSDVLCYFGDLSEVLSLIKTRLNEGGKIIFSLEKYNKKDFILKPSLRFGHNKDYITNLLKDNGYNNISLKEAFLRKERKKDINGYIISAFA
ncbi:MAG: Methyltransferase domain protein [Alphaproteobacteria bacterium ADurb.Bin438]|nr:MAG: Methyltransferase domain protein [Alphaproteobacteria bacterium ADurb.Bin438]